MNKTGPRKSLLEAYARLKAMPPRTAGDWQRNHVIVAKRSIASLYPVFVPPRRK
jgi:hypothetical protein